MYEKPIKTKQWNLAIECLFSKLVIEGSPMDRASIAHLIKNLIKKFVDLADILRF